MSLYNQILAIYPTLKDVDFLTTIHLQNDSDGKGDYIKSWTNSNPQPTQAQLEATGK
jgi:hypothetical protein